jgi:Ca2+-binding RTX toxin-like protein
MNLGRTEESQVTELATTLDAIHRYSGALGVTDYRWFNLRDNDSTGTDLFDAVGLLRDDYSEKPAFAALRTAIDQLGTDRPRTRRCANRVATIIGTNHRDRLRGGSGPDVIFAGRGADKVTGHGGADLICGGPGPDRLRGGPGRDALIGGPGGDRLIGGAGRDRCPHLQIVDRARSCNRGG